VRGLNAANEYTAWVECAAAATITATTNTDPIPDAVPADPTSVTTTVTDKEGNYGLTTQWTAPTVMTAVAGFEVQARFYTDSGGSSPDGEWIALGGVDDLTVRLDSGFWPRPTDAVRYVRTRVRSLNVYGTPGAWVQAASLATVAVLAVPPAPTVSGSTTVGSSTRGGVASFNFTVVVTPSGTPGTTEGYEVQVRYYTDSGASTPESNWIPLGWVDPSTLTLSTDYWPRPTATRYAKLRIAGKNADNVIGSWVESGVLTISSGELDLREAAESTFGVGLKKDSSNRIALTARNLLLNGDFEFGLDEWGYEPGWTASTTEQYSGAGCAKFTANSANAYIYQTFPVSPGQAFRFEAYARESSNGRSLIFFWFFNSIGGYISGTSVDFSGDTWTRYQINMEAPAAAVSVTVGIQALSDNTTGRVLVDQCAFSLVEPLTGADLARVNGILGLAGGSLSQEAKYGSNAKPIIIGTGAPSNSDGRVDGSYYLDTGNSSKIYKKVSGAWTGIVVGDLVAGNFIGFTLSLNLNSVTTTINNASSTDDPAGTIYPGLRVTNNSTGEYSYAAFGGLGVNISGNNKYSYYTRTQAVLAYKASGVGYPRIVLDNTSDSAIGLAVYAPGTGTTSTLRAQIASYANYATVDIKGAASGAGYMVDGTKVVGARGSGITAAPSFSSSDYNGNVAGATYGATEQSILNSLANGTNGFMYRVAQALSGMKTTVDQIQSRLQSHGLIS
jgi:hypothetical protein